MQRQTHLVAHLLSSWLVWWLLICVLLLWATRTS